MMPCVILYDNNITEVAFKTGWSEEALRAALKFYKDLGVYPVKVPLPVKAKIFETYGREEKYPDAWK